MKASLVTMGMIGLALWGMAAKTGGEAPGEPQLKPAVPTLDYRAVTDLIHNGRSDSALVLLGAREHARTSDPMVYLLRARALRDQMVDEDDNKSLIKNDGAIVLANLDSAIAICDAAVDRGDEDPRFRYYRGRAYLAKAQIHTLTHGYWSAGRSAANAKDDLESYLRHVPNDPDAQGDLGAFLYFADTLPGVLKFISKLFRIPGGDRERGLEMIQYAASSNGVFRVDYQIALAAIDLLFEGRLERGAVAMRAIIDQHPGYTRLVEPFGVLVPLDPLRVRDHQRLEERVLAERLGMVGAKTDWSLVKRIRLHRAIADIYFRGPRGALDSLTTHIENPVERPDWFLPLAIVNRGQLYAKSGRAEEALQAFNTIVENEEMNHFHSLAYSLIESLKEPWKVVELEHLDFIAAIYEGRPEEADAGLKAYGRLYGRDVVYYFYLGETETFRQDFPAAQRAYEAALAIDVEGGDENYQLLSSMRLAELAGIRGEFGRAKKYVEDATTYTHAGYLFDFMIESRKSYFKALEEGTVTTGPTLLVKKTAPPESVHQ